MTFIKITFGKVAYVMKTITVIVKGNESQDPNSKTERGSLFSPCTNILGKKIWIHPFSSQLWVSSWLD